MTAAQTRDAIEAHLDLEQWTPIAELAEWMARKLLLSRGQGQNDLRVLLRDGRIERRATVTEQGKRPAYEYRRAGGGS